jgi:hypothetical protein
MIAPGLVSDSTLGAWKLLAVRLVQLVSSLPLTLRHVTNPGFIQVFPSSLCFHTCNLCRRYASVPPKIRALIEDAKGLKVRVKKYKDQAGKHLSNRSTYQVKPFYLSSETVLHIKRNRSTYHVKPF